MMFPPSRKGIPSKRFTDYFDGLLLDYGPETKYGDGGDSLAFTCFYLGLTRFLNYENDYTNHYNAVLHALACGQGNYKRHDKKAWASNCDVMSRDQAEQLVFAMGFFGDKKRIKNFVLHLILRFGFFTNTRVNGDTSEKKKIPDVAMPHTISCLIRAYDSRIVSFCLWPLLITCDFAILIDVVFRTLALRLFGKPYDPTNITSVLILSTKYSNPVVWLARKIFVRYAKPLSMWTRYCVRLTNDLQHYFLGRNPPPFYALWPDISKKL